MERITHPINLVPVGTHEIGPLFGNQFNEFHADDSGMILCYPNTFLNAFQIQTDGNFEYLIFDMAGNELEKGAGRMSAAVGEKLLNGLYMIQIKNSNKNKILKVEKN